MYSLAWQLDIEAFNNTYRLSDVAVALLNPSWMLQVSKEILWLPLGARLSKGRNLPLLDCERKVERGTCPTVRTT